MIKTCEEIYNMNKNIPVVKVNIIGPPGSGKTEQIRVIAHIIHKIAKEPYSFKLFDKKALLNFRETLKSLTVTNWVLGFDDLSFLGADSTRKQIEIVKQAETEIRHLPGGQDVKIIIIKVSHYTLALDKFLRQNNFTYFTSVGSSEYENMERIVGSKNMAKVLFFKRLMVRATSQGKFGYQLRKDRPPLTYSYKDPFIPLLFWNEDTLRIVDSPNRNWLDKYCDTCAMATGDANFKNIIDTPAYLDEIIDTYGESKVTRAIKNISLKQGVNVEDPRVITTERAIERDVATGKITMDELRAGKGLKTPNTKLRKPITNIIQNTPIPEILNNDNK
jgi:energy-coupling factor transporter ATP-binding protein EcfA2